MKKKKRLQTKKKIMDSREKIHDIRGKEHKTLAQAERRMIRYTSQKQIPIEEFKTPLETKLSRENRWVKLAKALPWDELAKIYHRAMPSVWRESAQKTT